MANRVQLAQGFRMKSDSTLKISNVYLVDIKRRKIINNRDIYIKGGEIERVDSHSENDGKSAEMTIDAAGKYVTPGLIDSHLHVKQIYFPDNRTGQVSYWNYNRRLIPLEKIGAMLLRAGVTAFIDTASLPQKLMFDAREIQRNGDPGLDYDMPDIYTSGVVFTAKWEDGDVSLLGYPGKKPEYGDKASDHIVFLDKKSAPYQDGTRGFSIPEKEGEVERLFEPFLDARKPDVVKIAYSLLTDNVSNRQPALHQDTISKMIELANSRGIPVLIHSETPGGHADMIGIGAHSFAHLAMFDWNDTDKQRWENLNLEGKRVYVTTTLSLIRSVFRFWENGELEDDFLRHVLEPLGNMREEYLRDFRNAFGESHYAVTVLAKTNRVRYRRGYRPRSLSIKSIAQSFNNRDGLILLAGTDAQNFGVVFGYSMHQELEALVDDVNLSTWEALESATILPGEFLKKRYGVDEGDIANLLILNKDPTEDIRNLREIENVILRGKVINL